VMNLWEAVKGIFGKEYASPGVPVTVPVPPISQMPRADPPPWSGTEPFECEICHASIEKRNTVVCVYDGGDCTLPRFLAFGVPKKGWGRFVCSMKCAHAMLDREIVTWHLTGQFGGPEEVDEY
jgi:hypothetical protein